MTVDGQDIYHMGDKAKVFQKHQETIEKKDAEIALLSEKIRALEAERDALRGSGSTASHRAGARVSQ
jgi:hypothetical protein